jgi:hypothetical protein
LLLLRNRRAATARNFVNQNEMMDSLAGAEHTVISNHPSFDGPTLFALNDE